ncbi:MurR/RpiR family transcriptional regulator [Cohaesibacter celericrescens]|uniref:MurR/RpiR family transcriptional regulator n=1 Tax=Cohaesibacter celericrescens TaxID=2067669 RepID=A0A2N5XK61_9HYPH|nr:MurR/RpiR family transcriptional regulator [Cohaesibacter celericrescens]PLW74909.1 MurR/RpiR family transcriptional regulator [Cohaesibacter celericrescens]
MKLDDLRQLLWDAYPDLSPQMKVAASYVLENPADVAFKSVRQLAKAADVHPSTIVRLAQVAGFSTFDPFRAVFQKGVQAQEIRLDERAAALQKDGRWGESSDAFVEIGQATLSNLTSLFQPDTQRAVQRIAKAIIEADRVYVSGYRSSFAFAHYLAYAGKIALPSIRLLESPDGSHFDILGQAGPRDLIILFTFAPYASEGGRLLTVGKKRGCKIIAITDAMSSPAVPLADLGLFVPMTGPQLLPSLVPAASVCELILAECARLGGSSVVENLRSFRDQVHAVEGYLSPVEPSNKFDDDDDDLFNS